MLPSDPWDYGSPGGQPTSSRDEARAESASPISINHLAVLLSAQREGTPGELTRDFQLNDIVEQACLATGATGAAIALARGDELICRASTGSTAPDLGVGLNTEHGLSGFCVHTREVQRCDDSDFDPRVDAEACRQLGVRSVLVIPVIYGDVLLGIFEVFSPHSFAFHDRDAQTLLALSRSVLIALGISTMTAEARPAEPESLISPEAPRAEHFLHSELTETRAERANSALLPRGSAAGIAASPEVVHRDASAEVAGTVSAAAAEEFYPQFKIVQKPARDYWTGVLTFLVVTLALLLGWMLGHGRMARKNAAREELRAAVAAQQARSALPVRAETSDQGEPTEVPSSPPTSPGKPGKPKPSPDGLVVYKDGKIIFRQVTPPRTPRSTKDDHEPGSLTPVELPPEVAGTLLIRRLEPHYPERARRQNVQGAVILQALVSEDGGVQQLKVLIGNADLALAAIDAVRQWRFKPYAPKGKARQFETRITVNFALPSAQPVNH